MKRAVLALLLAPLAGCGSCVKDESPSSESPQPGAPNAKKPLDLRAADKRFSQFSEGGADASRD
ncbi:MAG: hypothetical protein JWP87_2345 [Labilithrix sp.]|nr:hypothetical protein [Labilithrix sp.]